MWDKGTDSQVTGGTHRGNQKGTDSQVTGGTHRGNQKGWI